MSVPIDEPIELVVLDVDGVLNHSEFLCEVQRKRDERRDRKPDDAELIDERAVQLLERFCADRSALVKVVISSTWRRMMPIGRLARLLQAKGLAAGRVISKTPYLGGKPRGQEIQDWLDLEGERYDIKSFVIIDDDSDMIHLSPRLLQTHFTSGLLSDHEQGFHKILDRAL